MWLATLLFFTCTAVYALFCALVLEGLAKHRESWKVMVPTVLVLLAFSIALVAQTISSFLEALGS